MEALRPASRVAGTTAYRVPRHPAPVDLDLRGNEGAVPDPALLGALSGTAVLGGTPTQRRCRLGWLPALGCPATGCSSRLAATTR